MKNLIIVSIVLTLIIPSLAFCQEDGTEASSDSELTFISGLNDLNKQLIAALGEQPTRRVIVLPFPDMNGEYTRVSAFIREQMITALAASREYQIVADTALIDFSTQHNIPPMELGNTPLYQQLASNYQNVSIVAGSLTDLNKKIAVMARIIQGPTGNYGGAAIVYLPVEDEIAALLQADREDRQAKLSRNRPIEQVETTSEELGKDASDQQSTESTPENDATKEPVEETPAEVTIPRPDIDGQSDLAIYRMGRDAFVNDKFSVAIGYFEEVINKYPESELADNALYWIGESFYGMRNWQQSKNTFQKVLDEYPYGNKVPAATLKRGYAEEKLGNIDAAIQSIEELLRRFPDSAESELARKKLQLLRAQKQ